MLSKIHFLFITPNFGSTLSRNGKEIRDGAFQGESFSKLKGKNSKWVSQFVALPKL